MSYQVSYLLLGLGMTLWLVPGVTLCWMGWFAQFRRDESRWFHVVYWLLGPLLFPPLWLAMDLFDRIRCFRAWGRSGPPPKTWDAFLSYSHWDCLWASAIYGVLRLCKAEVFLDFVAIQRGPAWRSVAEAGIFAADTFLLIESPDSSRSEAVQFEIRRRRQSYAATSQAWRNLPVPDSTFPDHLLKGTPLFKHETGIIAVPIPGSPHANWKYKTPSQTASSSIANLEGWLEINLPAVHATAALLGLDCPPRQLLEPVMREYLGWAAGGPKPLRPSEQFRIDNELLTRAREGDQDAARSLLKRGAQIGTRGARGETPLLLAAQHGHLEIVKVMLAAGADPNDTGTPGRTALICASKSGHIEVVRELVASGANCDREDNHGITALMWAAKHRHTEVVETLLRGGADVRVRDLNGHTALHRARRNHSAEIERLLRDAGAAE